MMVKFMKSRHAQILFWKIFFTSYKGGFYHKIANSVKYKNDLLYACMDFNKKFCDIP